MKVLAQFLALAAATSVSAAIFPSDTTVKLLNAKTFKQAMKQNKAMAVAFVAPWCGHCQKMAPEYSKAAKGLNPLVPLYAVDCDVEGNKRLCSEQGIKGFPTLKGFPRGDKMPPREYDGGERTAGAIFKWASSLVSSKVHNAAKYNDIASWTAKNVKKPRALLITKDKRIPLMWQVLSNKYRDTVEFAIHRDPKGASTPQLGLGELDSAKVLVYPAGEKSKFIKYEGITKYVEISKFFKGIVDGSAVPAFFGAADETVSSAASVASETASSVVSEATKKAKTAASVVGETASSVVSDAKETASVVGEKAKRSASEANSAAAVAAESASSVASVVSETASSVLVEATETASSIASEATETAKSAASVVEQTASSVASRASSVATEASSTVVSAASVAGQTASSIASEASSVASVASETVSSVATEASSTVSSAASVAGETAASVVSDASSVATEASSTVVSAASVASSAASVVGQSASSVVAEASSTVSSAASGASSVVVKATDAVRDEL